MLTKLLEPVRAQPRPYLKGLFQRTFMACGEVVFIIIVQGVARDIQSGDTDHLLRYALRFAGILVVTIGGKYLMRNRRRPNSRTVSTTFLRKKYFHLLIQADSSHLEKLGTGRLIDILNQGIEVRERAIETIVRMLPDISIKLIFSLRVVGQMGRHYAVGYVLFLIGTGRFSVWLNRFVMKYRKERKEFRMRVSRRFVRFLMSRLEILQSNQVEKETAQQIADYEYLNVLNKNVNTPLHLMYNIPVAAVQALVFLIVLYSIQSLQTDTFSYAVFAGMMAIVGFLTQLVINVTSNFKDLTKDFFHVEKLREAIDEAPKMKNYDCGEQFQFSRGDIVLKNVNFAYQDGTSVFHNFSLEIIGGQKTALVGHSGSGKSTLVKLINGLMMPDEGSVLIDGQDIATVSLKSFFPHIGFLQQEPIVFDGTVRENLEYGLEKPLTQHELKHILQQANAAFVRDLKHGLETEVGERGIRLSGGQKQRLAIARIFAKNPDIIILDEPTSALDSFAEEAITEAMYKLFEGRTVIIIAHRLQTVKSADDIIVLEDGQVIERGTHKELTKHGGYYAKMLKLQTGF